MRFAALLFCSGLSLFAQDSQSTPEKGLLAGKVLNSATGEPVRKAQVKLFNMGAAPKGKSESPDGGSAVTDAAGRFEFTALAPGSYALAASREGFDTATARGGQKLLRVTLADGEEKNDIVIRLRPFGVVTGRILDEDGDPLRQIQVQTMVHRYAATGRQLSSRGQAMTNDLGEYRIYDLPPGHYYLKAGSQESMGGGGQGESYGASYYPGTADSAAAAPLEVAAGQTLEGMDLALRPMRIANIRGRVMNPGSGSLTVGLLKVTEEGGSSATNTSLEDRGGKFELRGVSPGSYFLTAGSTIGGQHYSARVPIQVGSADLEGIELHLQPPMDIAGQIRIEGKTSGKLSRVSVLLESGGHSAWSGDGNGTKEDGSFAVTGLEPGVYQVTAQAPEDLYQKAVRWSDRDVMQSGLDLTGGASESRLVVVMSANGGQIDGVVEDDQSAPVAVAMVTLVPAGAAASKSLFKTVLTSPAGHFHMQGIAPGSYKLFAWEDADPNQVMYDPDFLKPFNAQAQSVEIAEGSQKSVQLALIKQAAEKPPSQ
jgi:carboxypeptidase family protein